MKETLPGLRVCSWEEFCVAQADAGKEWMHVCVAEELKHPRFDYHFPLRDEEGNDPRLFDAAVLTVLMGLRRGKKVSVTCRAGRSRSVSVAAAALALYLDLDIYSVCDVLSFILKREPPNPVLLELGHDALRRL